MPDNWIITLHRAGLDNTRRALKSFLAQDISVKVLVLDRESVDGFSQWARAKYPMGGVTVLWDRHDSVSGAWNRALRLVFDKFHCAWALVTNNDVELRPDTYRLLLADGGGFVTAVGVKDRRQMETANPGLRSPHPDFSCFLIRKSVYARVGPFDEGYLGAFGEDGDMHAKLHSLGIEAISIGVPYYHIGSGTLAQVSEAEAEAIRLQADRNRELFHRKWGFRIGSPEYDLFFQTPPPSPASR
jgi:GT2 family glycosyltransferase